ncbi:SIMPL domain-containing protein [Microbacterium sp. zg.Y1090]|uniref:SIMPL domain-containing protein n=1 Tax=Microbacterium wangruii TaxID=3049073 RepID=UPI00214D9055|nr:MULTISPECIES: SIMPL domain-containing protein [unclassified Microbacterium]MCR2819046.1 SIMPL domain-containing protein [Microbacterium sp. zg.Y1090]MDL5487696.1 SIMPL domain-containing protein [Microbacterium sp. zg-Y1211]WIM27350.1 SIMPL domain-containing protein [Microbacterium sp. zg-Y1090]
MSDVIISVRGEHERRVAPEHGVVSLNVTAEGPDRSEVVGRVTALTEPLTAALDAGRAEGRIVEWSSGRVTVWTERPWNDGQRLAPVHHASVELSVTFDDAALLSTWVTDTAERDGVQIAGVDWQLTPATRGAVERDVASEAVGVAVDRATAYAAALGRGTVTPLEVADVGLLVTPDHADSPRMMRASFAVDESAGPALRLQPEDIVVSAAVEARFSAH